jgi:hypothetical protein
LPGRAANSGPLERGSAGRPHVFRDLQGGAESAALAVDGVGGGLVDRSVQPGADVHAAAVQARAHPQLKPWVEGVVADRAAGGGPDQGVRAVHLAPVVRPVLLGTHHGHRHVGDRVADPPERAPDPLPTIDLAVLASRTAPSIRSRGSTSGEAATRWGEPRPVQKKLEISVRWPAPRVPRPPGGSYQPSSPSRSSSMPK